MVQHLSRLARVLVIPFIVALSTWRIVLALNGQPLANPLAQLIPNGNPTFLRICNSCPGGLRPVSFVPGFEDGTAPPLGPIDPQFVDAASSDPVAFARTVDRFARSESRTTEWDPGKGSSNAVFRLTSADTSRCTSARPLVVVTRTGASGPPDDVAQTYYMSSAANATTGSP
jgi:hypothetical protein